MILDRLQMKSGESLEEVWMSSVADFLVKPFLSQESDWDLKTLEGLSFLNLLDVPRKSNHIFYSLKTSEAYSVTTKDKHLQQSSLHWMNWGMMLNGRCLTARISAFPKVGKGSSLSDIIEPTVDTSYFLSESAALEKEGMTGRGIQVVGHLPGSFEQNTRVFSPKGLAPTLTTMSSTDKIPKIIQDEQGPTLKLREATKQGYVSACEGDSVALDYPTSITHRGRIGHQIAHTLTTSGNQGVTVPSQDKEHQSQLTIRRLTPRECFRLQGFPDWAYDKAVAVNSKSQLYKQAGNSVSVPVITAIAQRLKRIEELEVS
ncbi:Modification methylase HpaII [Streptococcus intermedius]|nr:Modification methylase HpaII [Streptococcus intermedius]RSJ17099.1 Modification methylase HpaII [Streptococcus intermedius]RSJ32354.1 Modification methylase HpaII [Streptococcus intermedius]